MLLGLGSGLWVAARPAAGDSPSGDGAPAEMVAFFAGGVCPKGWSVAASAQGRLVVGVTTGPDTGIQVGEPLGDQEDRSHEHAYSLSVVVPYKSVSGANGGTNGAAAKTYMVSGTSTGAVTGLPFAQVQACVKQ